MGFPCQFIAATTEINTREKAVPLYYFRKTFYIDKEVDGATLTVGSLGYYEVHLNGADITKGAMAPYRSNPDHYVYFDRYTVTVKPGKNVIAFLLGNGLQNSIVPKYWDFEKLPWRSAPAVAFELKLVYQDGTEELLQADPTVKVAPSPIVFNDFHYGEYYDARLELPGWDMPEFDDSGWQPALPVREPRGEYKLCTADPVRVIKEIKPVAVIAWNKGWIYDFGINTAGLCKLQINGKPGQKLVFKHFELMLNGEPYFKSVTFFRAPEDMRFQEDEYTCAGGKAVHTPRFTYHGFRYVYVTGLEPEQATPDLLTLQVIHSDLKKRGSFCCDHEVANKIQAAAVQSDYTNFHYFPTDCPHREKNGWTADAALSAEQTLLNMEPEKSYKEWLHNIYKAMKPNGQLPGIIPTGGWGYEWGNGPAWDNVILWLPYFTYRYRGDRQILEDAALPIMRYLTYLYTWLDNRDLLEIGLGDWCEADTPSASAFHTPLAVTDSILAMDIAQKAALIYEILEMPEHLAFAKALEDRLKSAIRTHLIDHESAVMQGDTQTGQAMGLFYGLFTDAEKPKAFERLLALIDGYNGRMKVGVLGGRCIFRVLAEHGYADLAFNMITRPDFPSYGNWIAKGATTLWEDFRTEGSGVIASNNHHFWGDVSGWFYRYAGGLEINPTGRDITHANIAPCFLQALNQVKAEHWLPAGRLAAEWSRSGEQITLNITVPTGVHGELRLPKGWHFANGTSACPLQNGSWVLTK